MKMLVLVALVAGTLWAQEEKPDPRVRTYVYPTRIVAASAAVKHDDGWPARCDAVKMDLLLARKHGQVSEGYFGTSTGTRLVNRGDSAYVILDFGRELQGGVQLGVSKDTTPLSRVRRTAQTKSSSSSSRAFFSSRITSLRMTPSLLRWMTIAKRLL